MNLTKIKLILGNITKFDFKDFTIEEKGASSGFLKIALDRKDEVEVSEKDFLMFFTGLITAFEGEESSESDPVQVLKLEVEFTLKYSGEFDTDELSTQLQENEWFFKKDAGVFLHSVSNRFLSDTAYRSINFPYQQ
jgi:hypothetical protein